MHFLVPFEKVKRYLSSPLFPIHRSGINLLGSGKILEFMEIDRASMLTDVPAGMTYSFLVEESR